MLAHFADQAGRRLLLHGRRPRAAHRPPQGPARQHRPQRQRDGGHGSWCAWASSAAAAITCEAAEATLQSFAALMEQYPTATGQMLLALDLWLGPTHEIVLLGDPAYAGHCKPCSPICDAASSRASSSPFGHRRNRRRRSSSSGRSFRRQISTSRRSPIAYVCENFACQAPACRPRRHSSPPGTDWR